LQASRFNIAGVRRADLKPLLPQLSPASISRYLKRLLLLGIIKKISSRYRYYLTRLGSTTIAVACRLSEQFIMPALAG
jgi:DNA-binding HxlR family transcriptional regulator